VNTLQIRVLATVLILMCLLTGCFKSNPDDIRAFVKPYEVDVTAENYVFQPPDEIEIHCAQVAEVHLQRQRIRPDGKISFEALGEIEVAGKTPQEVAEVIKEKVKSLYQLPGDNYVDVRVAAYASKVFYVLGQVARPGPRNYTGRDTLMMSLANANPVTTAWEQRVQVIRPTEQEGERPMIFEVNYAKMMAEGDLTMNVLLEEGDIVYVPPTILASIAMTIEEFITPVARAFYGYYLVSNPPTGNQGYSATSGGRY
jgi:protein involved in polysaccharide export with SLBB domain